MQKTYELMVLLHPDLEIDVEAPITKVENLIADAGGKVLKRDNWGKKRLAYRIARQDFAIYVYFEVTLPPEGVAQLDSTILIMEEVLRHILVVHEENPPRAEAKKDDRGDKKAEVVAEAKGEDEAKADEKEGDK
ncbi:MAG TPA: 30S ribosomal protein S6 [Candidatus Saccharimonadia bacterium]|nr:30S ribosomal protein S6 [Candidatus Saccharimonadia bacterium]